MLYKLLNRKILGNNPTNCIICTFLNYLRCFFFLIIFFFFFNNVSKKQSKNLNLLNSVLNVVNTHYNR